MMSTIQAWQAPAVILAMIGIAAVMFRSIRTWARHERMIEEHTEALRKCSDKSYVTANNCVKAQKECRDIQAKENAAILSAIEKLADRVDEDARETRTDVKEIRNHLSKVATALGRIEGIVGRHKLDE